jgi:hypothetical protein
MCICCILCLSVVNVCVFVVLLCVFAVSHMYLLYLMCICCTSYVCLLYYVCIAVLTLDAGLLARSQHPEGPQHRVFLVSLCLQANAEMVSRFPSCYYMPLM